MGKMFGIFRMLLLLPLALGALLIPACAWAGEGRETPKSAGAPAKSPGIAPGSAGVLAEAAGVLPEGAGALAEAGDSPAAPAVELGELVREATENNPAIQAARETTESKKARVPAEKALPDPMLSFQSMGNMAPPTLMRGDPSSGRFYSVQQEFPFPGKRDLKGKIASTEAGTEEWNTEQTSRQVVADLKKAFYDYYLACISSDIVRRDMDLLQSFSRVAETKYRVGQGGQQDVIKAGVEISRQRERLAGLDQRREILAARISSLAYRPPGKELGRPAPFKKDELAYSFEELCRVSEQNAPAIKIGEQGVTRSEYAVELARKEYYPDVTLGLTYVEREANPDMYGLMVSAKVPLYFWEKQRPELEAAARGLSSARKQKDSAVSTVAYALRESFAIAATSEKLLRLYETTLIPQSRSSLEAAFAGYQVGSVDFLTLVDSLITLRDNELKYHEALVEYEKALAQLEAVTGVEVTASKPREGDGRLAP